MIRVNLAGTYRRKSAKVSRKFAASANATPVLLALILVGAAAGGYWWYSSVSAKLEEVDSQIALAEAQTLQLEQLIRQDQVYETRKNELEDRIVIIENLQRNQISPVVSLDSFADAIDRTQFVWLSSLDQNNTVFTMSGIGTSVNAIADFVTNLENTGYFRNVNLVNAQDSQGNFVFSMTCEFSLPARTAGNRQAAGQGGN